MAHGRTGRGTVVPVVPPGRGAAAARDRRLPYAFGMPLRTLLSLALGLALGIAACTGATPASFDPSGPCINDGSAPGAYPELEARVPTTYEDRAPDTLDSGRNCSSENLGTLADDGFEEIRFAGGTWAFGAERAAVLVVFSAPGLDADAIADFYTTSARAANRTRITGESTPTLADRPGRRLDTTTGSRTQTVVVWPAAEPDFVNVVISNDLPDPKILAAVDAFGGR